MRKLTLICTLSLFSLFAAAQSGLRAQQAAKTARRHRIAVLGFSNSAAKGGSQMAAGADAGRIISGMLIDRLVSDGTYQVMEPNQMQKILKAHDLSSGNPPDLETAAKIGHVLGVDAVVVGDVTQFGRDEQGGNTAGAPGKAGSADGAKTVAVVAITAEFVDTNTGQALASANSKGVSQHTGPEAPAEPAGSGGPGSSAGNASSNFAQTLVGQAATAAVDELARQLEGENSSLPRWTPPPLRGQITEVLTARVVINVGSAAGLKVGDKMLVTRVVHVVRDQGTGAAVGSIEDEVGVLTITSVQEGSAEGRFSGAGKPEVGDAVRPVQ